MNEKRRKEQRISDLHVHGMPGVGKSRGLRQAMGPRSVGRMFYASVQMAAIVQDEPPDFVVNVH